MSTAPTTSTHSHPAVGDTFIQLTLGNDNPSRVMAISEGWAMMREKHHRNPFCVQTNDLMSTPDWQLHCPICKPLGCHDDDCDICHSKEKETL